MRLHTLSLTIAAVISTTGMPSVFAEENCQLLTGKEDIDISRTSAERCIPGKNPRQAQQWNLLNNGQDAYSLRGGNPGFDLNLWWPHRLDLLGNGVKVAVVDDGLEIAHPDLASNIRPGSRNVVNGSNDPSPTSKDDAHGTSVAGIIAAVDNEIGVKGIAPHAQLQGFNMIAQGSRQLQTDWLDSLGRSTAAKDNRLFNQSYGYNPPAPEQYDALNNFQLEGLLESMTLKDGGAAYVKSAGNSFSVFSYGTYAYLPLTPPAGLPFHSSNIETSNTNFWNLAVSATNANGVRAS